MKNYFINGTRFGANIQYVLDDPEYKGNARTQGGLISKFIEKPELEQPVCVGISILNGVLLGEMQSLFETEKKSSLDLMGEFIPYLIEQQHPIKAYVSDAFWYDLGSLERYEHFENEGLSKRMSFLYSRN